MRRRACANSRAHAQPGAQTARRRPGNDLPLSSMSTKFCRYSFVLAPHSSQRREMRTDTNCMRRQDVCTQQPAGQPASGRIGPTPATTHLSHTHSVPRPTKHCHHPSLPLGSAPESRDVCCKAQVRSTLTSPPLVRTHATHQRPDETPRRNADTYSENWLNRTPAFFAPAHESAIPTHKRRRRPEQQRNTKCPHAVLTCMTTPSCMPYSQGVHKSAHCGGLDRNGPCQPVPFLL